MNALQKERQRHHISLKYAIEGVAIALQTQPNFLYHGLFSVLAILFCLLLRVDRVEWVIILMTIVLGFVIEMANTAIEAVVDLVTDSWHKDAKRAKDVAAGMMLLYAYGSVVIAIFIFAPHFLALLGGIGIKI